MPVTYEPIATNTLSVAANTITFNSIPATYTDLRIIMIGQGNNTAGIYFNGSTATNYSTTGLGGDGSSAFSTRQSNSAEISIAYPGYGLGIGQPVLLTVDIFSYTSSANKSILSTWSADYNGNGLVSRCVGLWRSTATISSLTLNAGTGFNTFSAGMVTTLFGIKSA